MMVVYSLTDPIIYGKHNTRSTIEQVYVNPLKKELETWEKEIVPKSRAYCPIVDEMKAEIKYYEEHKHLLGGE